MSNYRRFVSGFSLLLLLSSLSFPFATAAPNGGRDKIRAADMKEWLSYLSSDELEGRRTYSEGLGLAAAYIANQLKSMGVQPGGDNGSYLQRVRVLGVKSTNHSTITVEANGQTRVFKDGEGIRLLRNVGGKREFSSAHVEFVGYGLTVPGINHNDFSGRNVKGKVAVWLGAQGPQNLEQQFRRVLGSRARNAIEQEGAIASIGQAGGGFGGGGPGGRGGQPPAPGQQSAAPLGAPGAPQAGAGPGGRGGFGTPIEPPDFTTVQRLDQPIAPQITGQDEFFQFLFNGQELTYDQLKEKAAKRETLPPFSLKNVKITFNVDAEYRVVQTQFTRNVVGIVTGRDAKLKDTFVAFGAHYDHVGYAEGEVVQTGSGSTRAGARGRVKEGALDDRIWNGADDDGSGSVTMLAIAKAFAQGPKPKRSAVFVWHAGEENGLLGSRFFADYPTIALEKAVAQINMDMVGRNRDDKAEESNSVYPVGSDRISTELHNLLVDSNDSLEKPLKLDFEMNDPTDLEQVYFRSDHYSYAVKGIPIVFLTTGLHPDYHVNTDSVEKIIFEKMERIGHLAYELGFRVANLDHAPARDVLGPRVGKGSTGKLKI